MITETEIRQRLIAVLERRGQSEAREKMARWGVLVIVPEVVRIVKEAVDAAKREEVRRDL